MNKNASKFIDKLYAKVDLRINKLEEKSVQIQDRWPYELYGCKADNLVNQYDDEIQDLKRWKNGQESTQYLREIIKTKDEENARLKIALMGAANTLAEYGEDGHAKRLRMMAESLVESKQ